MNKTVNFYKSLQVRKGLNHINRHKLLPLFRNKDHLVDDINDVVDSMILRVLPQLGINYAFCKPERNTTPHHFVVKYKVDGVGFIKGYQMPMKVTKEVILKYSSEELKGLSPLDVVLSAYKETNCTLMDGVKSSKLIDDICVYLHDAVTVKVNEHD